MGHFALGIPSLFLTARLVCNELFTLVFKGDVAPTYGADFGKTGRSQNKPKPKIRGNVSPHDKSQTWNMISRPLGILNI